MNIERLLKFGLPEEVIKGWRADGIRHLLPIQADSVLKFGLLEGRNLIISGPGTSGKTFCGEMAALFQASERKRGVYLTPLKAIADEKYELFRKRYSSLGLKVAVSTGDHNENDKMISGLKFDLLVTIYEKFNSLTGNDISIIRNCGCFILDEFQIISDPERGMEIELLLARLRKFNPSAQLVILMGGGSSAEMIADWLKLPLLEENRRPVDLRLGVLHRGTYHFRGFNDHSEGEEHWIEKRDTEYNGPMNDQSFSAIEHLAIKGEQIIVFASTRKNAIGLAEHLAVSLNLPAASKSLTSLDDLPPSAQNECLGRCLRGGTAFHHAELDSEQRKLVESGFCSGEIRILASTTTLAWGVNLPAKNVFIETMKYQGTGMSSGRSCLSPLSNNDFQQAAGRAGRVGMGERFGRAIMTASSRYEHEILWNKYVYFQSEEIKSGLRQEQFPDFIIRILACGAADSPDAVTNIINDLFISHGNESGIDFKGPAEKSFSYLEKGGLLARDKTGSAFITSLGKIASSSGFSSRSIIRIDEELERGEVITPLEWLYFALGLPEWSRSAGSFFTRGTRKSELIGRINALTAGSLESSAYISSCLRRGGINLTPDNLAELAFAIEWIEGRATRELEIFFDRGAGGLKRDASTLSWILRIINQVISIRSSDEAGNNSDRSGLAELSERTRLGLPSAMIPLARILDIDREFVKRLYDLGIKSPEDLAETDYSILGGILPGGVIERIRRRSARYFEMRNRTEPRVKNKEDNRLVFTAQNRGQLREALILGESVFLQPKLYSYLRKLWWGTVSSEPWVPKESLEPGFNQPKYISKLRGILNDLNGELRIESDGRGRYRLVLPERVDDSLVVGDDEHIAVDSGG